MTLSMRFRDSFLARRAFRGSLARAFIDISERGGQHIELLLPVLAVAVHPDRRIEHGTGIEAASADASGALLLGETRARQYREGTGQGLQRYLEGLGELGHEQCLPVEPLEDLPPHRIGE